MRIGILNDKPQVAEAIQRAMTATGRYKIAWSAGADADPVALCQNDRPDLLLIDLNSRDSACIRRIMEVAPCTILVSTETIEGNSAKVFDAMGAGALDVVQTPGVEFANGAAAAFLNKIDSVACLVGRAAPKPATVHAAQCARQLVAIGSSAGGPAALAQLLRDLPADLPAAVIVVQHIDAHFAPGLARWLGEQSKLPVKPAASGDMPTNGVVLLAATNDHLVFESATRLGYTRNPLEYSYRPSVNVFLESAARHWRGPVVGVLLTGMGSDGAKGLKMLRNLGHHTIAQDKQTSAVYGMPKAAVELKAAAEVLPLDRIASAIGNHCRPK